MADLRIVAVWANRLELLGIVLDAVVVAGDEVTTVITVKNISERAGKGFYVFESTSQNQGGELVCRGTWTNIVRGV